MNYGIQNLSDSQKDGQVLMTTLEEIGSAICELHAYVAATDSIRNSASSPVDISMLRLGVQQTMSRISDTSTKFMSVEDNDVANLRYSIEGISENISQAAKAFSVTMKRFWEWLMSFIGKLRGSNGDLKSDVEEKLQQLQDKSKQWGDSPPGRDAPEYPYDIPSSSALLLVVNKQISPNWHKTIPPLYATWLEWVSSTAETIIQKEENLIKLWESTIRKTQRDWSEFDALLLKTREEYRKLYQSPPELPGQIHVRLSDEKYDSIDDIRVGGTMAHVTHAVNTIGWDKNLSKKIRKVSLGDMLSTLESVIELLSSESDVDNMQRRLKEYQGTAERLFYNLINERGYPEDADLAEKSLDWIEATKRFKLINGNEIKTILFMWPSCYKSMKLYVDLVMTLSKISDK